MFARLTTLVPDRPFAYAQHHHFIDFGQFEKPRPIYFNIVRDPWLRFQSKFYYSRKAETFFHHQIKEMAPLQLGNKSVQDWKLLELEKCILSGDRESEPKLGDIIDSQLVKFNYLLILQNVMFF